MFDIDVISIFKKKYKLFICYKINLYGTLRSFMKKHLLF